MRRPIALFAALATAGMSCGGSSDPATLQAALRSFETSSQQTADAMVALYEAAIELKGGLDAQNAAASDLAWDKLPSQLDKLDAALTDLQKAEDTIQAQLAADGSSTSALQQRLGSGKGFLASLKKLFDLKETIRELNAPCTQARERRDAAMEAADLDTAKKEQQTMNQEGYKVIEELGTGVSTTLVSAPFKPLTLGGKIFKTVAKKAYQKGLVAITSTPACETDVKAASCVVGLEKTDDQGQVKAPTGTKSVVVAGGGSARVRVDSTEFAQPPTAIGRDLVPIAEATAATVTRGDEVDDDGWPVDPIYVPWVMCFMRESPLKLRSMTCQRFDGGDSDVWDRMDSDAQAAWCKGKGFDDGAYSYMEESECRHTCSLMTTSPGSTATCTTPE